MWIKYCAVILILQAVYCSWDKYGNIDMYFEPSIYISKMPMGNGVELQMHAKDLHRVQGVDVETAEKKQINAEVNGYFIRIRNPPEYICLTFRLEEDSIARRCLFLERHYSRIDMSFNLHVERLNDSLPSYRIQWRSSEEEDFSILVYNTTHMKQFVQKTSFTALYNLRPGTTYVICVSSNVGRLHFTCSTWRTNQNGLDTEQVDRNNAFQIPAEVGGMGDTWTLIVWKPAKAYGRGRILAPEAYLLLAQQMGSQCPDQMIEMIQTTKDESVKETKTVAQAIKRAYFANCVDMKEIERHPLCSCPSEESPFWIDGMPYKNMVQRNYSFEFTFKGLARNSAYNFTVIPLVPFFGPSRWLDMQVSVFGQTGPNTNANPVAAIVISVICLLGFLAILAYLLVDRYVYKAAVNSQQSGAKYHGNDSHGKPYVFRRPDVANRGNASYGDDYVCPRAAEGTEPYEDDYMLPGAAPLPAFRSSYPGRDVRSTLPGVPELPTERKRPLLRIKNPVNSPFVQKLLKRVSAGRSGDPEPRQDNLESNYEEVRPSIQYGVRNN